MAALAGSSGGVCDNCKLLILWTMDHVLVVRVSGRWLYDHPNRTPQMYSRVWNSCPIDAWCYYQINFKYTAI